MNYRYRSVRCVHGFCLSTVGCEECVGAWVPDKAGHHLRRVAERRSKGKVVPATYKPKTDGVSAREWR